MSKPILYITIALIVITGLVIIMREYTRSRAAIAAASGEQAKSQALFGLLGLGQQRKIAEEQNRATAKDWLGTIESAASAVAAIAGGKGASSGGTS